MNLLFTAVEIGVSYLFPQIGLTLQGYRLVKTTYEVTKVATGIISGDPTTLGTAAKLVGKAAVGGEFLTCEAKQEICVKATLEFQNGIGTGCGLLGCYLGYLACVWIRS